MKLKNKIALITGASRGIGRAIALEFAKEGASVIINYNKSEEEANGLVKIIRQKGSEALAIKADLSNLGDIKEMIRGIMHNYKKIDILVNNSAVYKRNSFFDSTEESWSSTIDTNLKGAFFCSQLAAKTMLERKSGIIINISSNTGIFPRKDKGIEYGISKSGLIYLTQSLALTLAPYVRVNCIAPGYTDTDIAVYLNKESLKNKIVDNIPLKRTNTPEDIAKTALFLASDESRNITGQVITIDGGYSLRYRAFQ